MKLFGAGKPKEVTKTRNISKLIAPLKSKTINKEEAAEQRMNARKKALRERREKEKK